MRRSREGAREAILAAAERLLTDKGPQFLKLSDVAAAAHVVHSTVLHHFGSIDGLQAALAERMVTALTEKVMAAALPDDGVAYGAVVPELLFDAFQSTGAARLAAWLELTGEFRQLGAVRKAMDLVVRERFVAKGVAHDAAEDVVLISMILAMAVGLFGPSLGTLLGLESGSVRRIALETLRTQIAASIEDRASH